jgi:hypothetical protein
MVTDQKEYWVVALVVASLQLFVAVFAAYSSNQDILSDGACIGGIFGTLANLVILFVVAVWLIFLVIKSFKATIFHSGLKPLFVLVLSSTFAIFIGQYAALRCTV